MKAIFRPLVVASLIAAVINQILYFVATAAFGQEFLLSQLSTEDCTIPLIDPETDGRIISDYTRQDIRVLYK